MLIDNRICVGFMMMAFLDEFSNEEKMKDKNIQHILRRIKTKIAPIRNKSYDRWLQHVRIADKAYKSTILKSDAVGITINRMIRSFMFKMPELKKYYNFNDKYLKGFGDGFDGLEYNGQYNMSSLKVTNLLIENIEFEKCHYNYGLSKKVV
jgi:hypothetical protein